MGICDWALLSFGRLPGFLKVIHRMKMAGKGKGSRSLPGQAKLGELSVKRIDMDVYFSLCYIDRCHDASPSVVGKERVSSVSFCFDIAG